MWPGQSLQAVGQAFSRVSFAQLSGGLAVVGEESEATAAKHSSQPKAMHAVLPRDPRIRQLGGCCQSGGQVAGKEVPLVGIAQPVAGCKRTSHSSGQSLSVTKTNVGRQTLSWAKGNN